MLKLPQATVSAIVGKWKRLEATTAQLRRDRPRKLTEGGRRVLKCVARKNGLTSVASLTRESQSASGSNISRRTVLQELPEIDFLWLSGCTQARRTLPTGIVPTVKSGGGGMTVWGCF